MFHSRFSYRKGVKRGEFPVKISFLKRMCQSMLKLTTFLQQWHSRTHSAWQFILQQLYQNKKMSPFKDIIKYHKSDRTNNQITVITLAGIRPTISFLPEKEVREQVGQVIVGISHLHNLELLLDPLHLFSVAEEHSRLGALYALLPQFLPYVL